MEEKKLVNTIRSKQLITPSDPNRLSYGSISNLVSDTDDSKNGARKFVSYNYFDNSQYYF